MMLKDRLRMAARVLSSQPSSVYERPERYRSSWPSFAAIAKTDMKVAGRTHVKFYPTAAEIQDMYRMLDLLMPLPAFERNLLWARACGVPWALLQARFMLSRTHLNRRYRQAIKKCELILMGEKKDIA